MSTVTYYRRSNDTAPVVAEFDTDAEALVFARYQAIDMLAVPVIFTDSRERRIYVTNRTGPTIGHRGIV